MPDSSDGETQVAPDPSDGAERSRDSAPGPDESVRRKVAAGVATTLDTEVDSRASRKGTHPTDGDPVIKAGDVIADRYRVVDLIGKGGMGLVFVAEHIAIHKPVAIKVLGEEYSARKSVVERFMLEARAASRIRHPHIVDITDFGFVRDGVPYFVMEHLEGETLADRIRGQRRIPWPQARAIMVQICNALQAAHDKGVIHRDMKPENVFLLQEQGGTPFVKVLDFGIAKIIDDGNKSLTRTGTVMGTAGYMSPEQAQSLPLDVRTDIYSAGIIVYEMLTGRVPFDGDGFVGVLTKHVTERPLSMRRMAPEARIPPALDRVVLRALHKDREERYPSAEAFSAALQSLGDTGAATGWRRWAPAGVVTGVIVGAAAWTFSGLGDPEPVAKQPAFEDPPSSADADPPATADDESGNPPPPAALPTTPAPSPSEALPDVRELAEAATTTGSTTDALPPPPAADSSTGAPPAAADALPGINDPVATSDAADTATNNDGGESTATTAEAPDGGDTDGAPTPPALPAPPANTNATSHGAP